MFKTMAAAAAVTILLAPTAFAVAPIAKLTAGQYQTVTQYTASDCPASLITVGAVTQGEATVGLLGTPIERQTASPASAAPYAVNTISCDQPNTPLPGDFTALFYMVGKRVVYTKEFIDNPVAPQTTACLSTANGGVGYTLVSGNQTLPDSTVQTLLVDIQPPAATMSAFKITTTNSDLQLAGNHICYISVDTLYMRSGK